MLQIGESNYSPKLSKVELELLKATQSVTVLEAIAKDGKELTSIISSNFNALGRVCTGEELTVLTQVLIDDILTDFPKLTIEELKIATRKGIRGEFGEFFGLNAVSYHFFIKSFINGEKRAEAILKQIEHLAEQKRVKSPDEIAQIEKEFWENETKRIAEYKKTGVLKTDSYERLYKIYESAGKISLSNSEKWDYFEKARIEVVKELKLEAQDSMKPKPIIEQIKRIESKQTTKLDDLKIADYACRLVIEMVYSK